jgi:hypothetical protein
MVMLHMRRDSARYSAPVAQPKISLTLRCVRLVCGRFLPDQAIPWSFKCRFDATLGFLTLWWKARPVRRPGFQGRRWVGDEQPPM